MPQQSASFLKSPTVTRERGATIIALGSDYENLNETQLETLKNMLVELAQQADPPILILDLSHMRYFGSSFIEALFRAWNDLHSRPGGRMSLCGLSAYCREVVEITHLDQLWSIFDTRDQALEALSAP